MGNPVAHVEIGAADHQVDDLQAYLDRAGAFEGRTVLPVTERWATVYAGVDDVEAALSRAESLGGTRVYGPLQAGEDTRTGNVFGVYHRPAS